MNIMLISPMCAVNYVNSYLYVEGLQARKASFHTHYIIANLTWLVKNFSRSKYTRFLRIHIFTSVMDMWLLVPSANIPSYSVTFVLDSFRPGIPWRHRNRCIYKVYSILPDHRLFHEKFISPFIVFAVNISV